MSKSEIFHVFDIASLPNKCWIISPFRFLKLDEILEKWSFLRAVFVCRLKADFALLCHTEQLRSLDVRKYVWHMRKFLLPSNSTKTVDCYNFREKGVGEFMFKLSN